MTNEELAYIAGFFDGEGCVNFCQSGQYKTWLIRAFVRNCDKSIIDYIHANFGGRIETTNHKKHPHWKTSYCWRGDWDTAINFLVAIEPWVRIKKDQILVARLWNAIRNRGNVRPDGDYIETISLLVNQLQWLNRKCKRLADDQEPIQKVISMLPVSVDQIMTEVGYAIN